MYRVQSDEYLYVYEGDVQYGYNAVGKGLIKRENGQRYYVGDYFNNLPKGNGTKY